jgi:hypothetical protein
MSIELGGFDVSFSRLYQKREIKPKIFYDKDTIHCERHDNKIDYKSAKPRKIQSEPKIELENIETDWKTGIYKDKDINTNPFKNMKDLDKYYLHGEPRLCDELPMFVPSSRIYLNTKEGIEEQWALYMKKTRQTE